MQNIVLLLAIFMSGHFAYAADTPVPRSDKRPTKIWNRTGRLKEIPKRVTDAYPLSDQQNRRG
jgi:hypothetical protein